MKGTASSKGKRLCLYYLLCGRSSTPSPLHNFRDGISFFFVSRDEKADWQLRSKGHALYPRYELVDEFRRHSEGQTFHIVKLSYFLELFGASEKVIKQVQKEETLRDNPLATIDDELNEYLSKAIVNWIFANRQGTLSISFDSTGKGIPQLYIHGGSPKKCGAIYIFCPNLSIAALKIGYLTRQVLELAKKFDELMLFLVFPDETFYSRQRTHHYVPIFIRTASFS